MFKMDKQRLLELAGVETRHGGNWCVVMFDRYEATESRVWTGNASGAEDAILQAHNGSEELIGGTYEPGSQGQQVWGADGEEHSVVAFPL